MLLVVSSGLWHGLVAQNQENLIQQNLIAADNMMLCVPPLLPLPGLSPSHGLFAAAGEDGQLECFDLRARSSIATLDAAAAAGSPGALEQGCLAGMLKVVRHAVKLGSCSLTRAFCTSLPAADVSSSSVCAVSCL
jgi:hypothetical protein